MDGRRQGRPFQFTLAGLEALVATPGRRKYRASTDQSGGEGFRWQLNAGEDIIKGKRRGHRLSFRGIYSTLNMGGE